MKAIGYIRVSTEEQAQEGMSLDTQEERIKSYCKAKDWELIEVVSDVCSGKDLNRPGMRKIMDDIASGNGTKPIEHVIIVKLDRLTRSVRDIGYLVEDVFKAHNVNFSSIEDSFDTSTAGGRMVMNVIISVSQWEREAIGERTRAVLRHKKQNGQWLGNIPYGFTTNGNGQLVENPEQVEIIKKVKRLSRQGKSCREISNIVNLSKSTVAELKKTNLRTLKARYLNN